MVVCVCGSDCDSCEAFKASLCKGCNQTHGKIFWANMLGKEICPIYDCAVNNKKFTNCSPCKELPCKIFYDVKEPNTTQEEHRKGVERRVGRLKAEK